MTAQQKVHACQNCGTLIEVNKVGRPKKYCSRTCTPYEVAKANGVAKANKSYSQMNSVKLTYSYEQPEPGWQEKAYCKPPNDGHQPYFPGRGDMTSIKNLIQQTCNQCEVKQQCLDYAIQNDIRHGIWGGTSERQRRNLRREYKKNLKNESTSS